MKRTERRHLKDNELATLAANARQVLEDQKRLITAAVVAIVVVGGAALGYYLWEQHVQAQAHMMLADALTIDQAPVGPPTGNPDAPQSGPRFPDPRQRAQAALTKFKVVADAYPKTDAGIFARYREAAIWMMVGTPAEAATAYQEVIDQAGDSSIYGQMAELGLAQAQAQAGQFDQAITAFKTLAERKDTQLPVDGILIQLGRTYLDAGKTSDAQQAFNRIVTEFPESAFSQEAKQSLDDMKKT